MTGHKIKLGRSVTIRNGKIVRIHRLAAGQRKNLESKAKRESDKWQEKSK